MRDGPVHTPAPDERFDMPVRPRKAKPRINIDNPLRAIHRVLIVDDEPSMRKLLKVVLEREGFETVEVGDGREARQLLEERTFDLVISDMYMPNGTGMELLEFIHAERPDLPVIIATGKPTVEAAVECIKVGAFDYIGKPFELTKLRRLIREAVEACPGEGGNVEENPADLPRGRTMAGYRILETIGEGNHGVVFLAQKIADTTQTKRALKVLRVIDPRAKRRAELLQRFLNEGEASSKIYHPNVIHFVDYGLALRESIPYLVMEYFPAPSMEEVMPELHGWPLTQRVAIIRQLAGALEAIHERNICHRDVKPGNVMIKLDEKLVKLTDFGIARLPDSRITKTRNIMGSPAYMSPEAFVSAQVGPQSDIFSLGSLAFELLVGCLPFDGETIQQLAKQITGEPALDPRQVKPDFPLPLQRILRRMLRKDLAKRYPTTTELIKDLDEYLSGTPHSPTLWERVTGPLRSEWP